MDDKGAQIFKLYQSAKSLEEEERNIWRDCIQYVNNRVDGKLGQWKESWRQQMGGKVMLSFNEIRKFINRICGSQRSTKVEEKVIPRDDVSDPVIADILTDLRKFVYDINDADLVHIARAFRNMVITGRGFVKAEFSDEFDPMGDIVLKSVDPFNIYLLGPGERYDLLDRKGITEVLRMDKEEALSLFPDSKDILDAAEDGKLADIPVAGINYNPNGHTDDTTNDYYDTDEKKLIILRTQLVEHVTVNVVKGRVLDPEQEIPEGVKAVKKRLRKIRIYYTLGPKLLKEMDSPYRHGRFDIIGFFAYTDGGLITGVVQDLLDAQNEKNKRRSAIIHILNTSPRNNHWVKKGALDDVEKAQQALGGVGQLIEVNGDINQVTKPIESNLTAVPAIVGMEQQATQDMKEISGLHDAALGQVPEGVKSGRGIQQLQGPSETIIAELFDNYLLSRKLLAATVVSLIQQYYNESRRFRILGDYSDRFLSPQMQQVRDQIAAKVAAAMPGAPEEVIGMAVNKLLMFEPGAKLIGVNIQLGNQRLNDITVGKYDIAYDHVSQNPSTRRAQFYDLLNMLSLGIPVPPQQLVEASDLRNKAQLITAIDQAQQQQQAMAMAQAQMGGRPGATPAKAVPPQQGDIMFNGNGSNMPQMG